MKLESRQKLYIGSVGVAAITLAGITSWLWPDGFSTHRLWLLPTLALLIAVAGRFPFKVSPQGDATLLTLPLFMTALTLHPVEAVFVGAAGTLIAERLLKAPARVTIFNVSVSSVVVGLTSIVFWSLMPETSGELFTAGTLLAAVAAAAVFHVTDKSLLFGMITIIKGAGFWRRWMEAWAFEAVLEGSLLVLGMVGAQLVAHAWWWLPLMAVPFVSAYYGFRRSVEETVQKTRLAEELEKNLKELKETQAQLIQSAKLATVGTLAAGIAHEINNPLTVISARAELLLARLRNAEQVDMEKLKSGIDDVYQMTGRISRIVSGLLSYSCRSEKMSDIRLDELMDDSLPLLERKFEKKNVTLIKEYEQTPAVHVVANQLQQVFMNLVGNAIDAMPEWGTITLGCKEENGTAVAYVKDTGTGIPPAVLDRIFEPFFTTKEVGKGTGLGLFICHKIVTDHQGELSVESEIGAGTTFWVRLPLVESSISKKHEEKEGAIVAAS